MSHKEKLPSVSKPLLSVAIIAILLLGFLTYLSLSVSSSLNQLHVSVTTINLVPKSLNYSAYQIQNPSAATITLSYSFPQTSGSGELNTTSSIENLTISSIGYSYGYCGQSVFGGGTVNNCGVNIFPTEPEINYYPLLNTTTTFTVIVKNASSSGDYLFFPAGGECGHSIFLIVGDKIPNKLPSFTSSGCNGDNWYANISVIGIENMTGLNIPY